MSQENVELTHRCGELFSDWPSMSPERVRAIMTELFDPEVEWHDQRELPGATVHHGIDGVMRHLSGARDALDYEGVDLLEIVDAGDAVVAVSRLQARGRASGVSVEREVASVWSFRDNKVERVAIYGSRSEALTAAGLAE